MNVAKTIYFLTFITIWVSRTAYGQTLYVPGALGTSTTPGNVGIGTSTPDHLLLIHNSNNPTLGIGKPNHNTTGKSTLAFYAGNATQQNGFFVRYFRDATADRIGFIGGGGTENLSVLNSGNVGIGTPAPLEKLSVIGNIRIQGTTGQTHSELNFYRADGAKFATIGQGNLSAANSTFDISHYNGNDIRFMQNGSEAMRILASGNVGIGTSTTGTSKLAVEGRIAAREVNVLIGNWPDYVFEKNYNLRPLAEVENYINQNKHLPEVPAAKEMEANGVNLGEMNMLLLKKVEELTLYLIDQNEKLEMQRREVQKLKSELQILKSKQDEK
jgi:hypothetical protein